MKKLFLISFSVFLLILSLTLISCGDDGGGSASKDSGITAGTKWENVDFTGDKIRISISVDQYDNKATTPASERYVRGSDSAGSDEILNMVFDRNKKVRDMLGLDVEYMEVHHQFRDVQPYINEIVMSYNEGTSPDLFINDCFGTVRAAMDGSLYNVMEGYGDTSENFFDFQDEHGWYSEYMNGLTLNPAVKYVVAGDYFIDVLRAAHTLYINIDLFESYVGDIEANLYTEIKGDAFAPRNPYALEIDFVEKPPFFEVSPTHKARTWLLDPRAPKIDPPANIIAMKERRGGMRG